MSVKPRKAFNGAWTVGKVLSNYVFDVNMISKYLIVNEDIKRTSLLKEHLLSWSIIRWFWCFRVIFQVKILFRNSNLLVFVNLFLWVLRSFEEHLFLQNALVTASDENWHSLIGAENLLCFIIICISYFTPILLLNFPKNKEQTLRHTNVKKIYNEIYAIHTIHRRCGSVSTVISKFVKFVAI